MNLKKYLNELEKSSPLEALDELCFFYQWLKEKKPEAKGRWLVSRLRREEKKYEGQGIQKGKWPIFLRNPDWESEVWKRLGIEKPTDQTIPKMESEVIREEIKAKTTQEVSPKRRTQRVKPIPIGSDPFKSDGYGEVWGEETKEIRGLGNRRP